MKLNQPYYIEPRTNSIDLNGQWEFFWSDDIIQNFENNMWKYKTILPKSVFNSLHEAGILPDPYVGINSKLYHWTDEKIWYYRKKFTLDKHNFKGNAFLCFDGVAYYCRVWVNGTLIGEHEGMFGGPVCDVAELLNYSGENEVIVEVKACNFGTKENFNSWNWDGTNTQIVPWNIARDSYTSTGDFIVIGIWNRVRLELVEKLHISRPYLYTKSADEEKAELFLEFEIADGQIDELKQYYGSCDDQHSYTRAYDNGLTGHTIDKEINIKIRISEPDSGISVYDSNEVVQLKDLKKSLINEKYYELQFFSKTLTIYNPKLWYPNGIGEAFLYNVELELYSEGILCDKHEFMTGIRIFEAQRTIGTKYRTRWENFRFSINGKNFFLMGINWAPIDFLYGIKPSEYEWCLNLAKNAGIQMLRVWSGGGMPETDTFYELCDKFGIMVWQDHMLANTGYSQAWPHDILESQEAYNIYRIRNHTSLVLHCGGNEFDPYSTGNAATMFVISRIVKDLDPSRIFHYATPDKGSAHIYRDMEPVWYRHIYKELPFLAESGIHSFPSYKTLKKLISSKECNSILPDIASEAFVENYPELLNHFAEYNPGRVPRMLSRCSQIGDITNFTLENICEATHVQAYEFYTLMIQSMRENYPNCGGILPWLFKRPWATVGIQTVDGAGQPLYPYYAMLNTYKPINICLCLEWSIIAPYETVPLNVKIFNQNNEDLSKAYVHITIYRPDMTVELEKSVRADHFIAFGEFTPDNKYTDQCFIICADLEENGTLLSRSTYFIKCTSILSDAELYKKYRSKASENLYFDKGPWLKDIISSANRAELIANIIDIGKTDDYTYYNVLIKNVSDTAAYPVTIDVEEKRFFADENFFLLKPAEERKIHIVCDGDVYDNELVVSGWNCEDYKINLNYNWETKGEQL